MRFKAGLTSAGDKSDRLLASDMNQDTQTGAGDGSSATRVHTANSRTHWSVVLNAGRGDREAFGYLYST